MDHSRPTTPSDARGNRYIPWHVHVSAHHKPLVVALELSGSPGRVHRRRAAPGGAAHFAREICFSVLVISLGSIATSRALRPLCYSRTTNRDK